MKTVVLLTFLLCIVAPVIRNCSQQSSSRTSKDSKRQTNKTSSSGISNSTSQQPRRWNCAKLNEAPAILGVTISDIDRSAEAIPKLRELSSASTSPVVTRLVFDPITGKNSKHFEERLTDYADSAAAIHQVTCVIGEIADSHDLFNYFPPHFGRDGSRIPFDQWTQRLVTKLNDSVDIWEIGNELNGGWTGWKCRDDDHCEFDRKSSLERRDRQKEVMDATRSAYRVINELKNSHIVKADALIALTLYYNQDKEGDCAEYPEAALNTWLSNPDLQLSSIAKGIDLVFLSFYEGGCTQVSRTPEGIRQEFSHVSETFNSGKTSFGFGEIGYTDSTCKESKRTQNRCATKSAPYIAHYYDVMDKCLRERMQQQVGRPLKYVGGYFYWWFLDDVVTVKDDALTSASRKFGGEKCLKDENLL